MGIKMRATPDTAPGGETKEWKEALAKAAKAEVKRKRRKASNRGTAPGTVSTQFSETKQPKPPPERVTGEFDRLASMRHVLLNPASTDKTQGEKACRAWLKKSPGQFMESLAALEEHATVEATKVQGGEEVPLTREDLELEGMIRELITRMAPQPKPLPA